MLATPHCHKFDTISVWCIKCEAVFVCWCCVCGVWWWVVAEAHSLQSSALHQAATALGAALPPATVTIQKKSYCQVGGAAAILSRRTPAHRAALLQPVCSIWVKACRVECSGTLQLVISFFCFRMRAKTSEFLKVLNRAKIEEESKKKGSKIGAKSPFI